MRTVVKQPSFSAGSPRICAFPRAGGGFWRLALTALTCCTLFSACSPTLAPTAPSSRSGYQLKYGLGSDALLQVNSPDLDRRLAQHSRQPLRLDFSTAHVRSLETSAMPGDLNIELFTPEQDKKSRLLFHFADEGRLLDRASLDTKIRAHTWLLGFNANMTPNPEETTGPAFHLQSEFSGLLGKRQPQQPPANQGDRGSQRPSVTADTGGPTTTSTTLAQGATTSTPRPYYLAFHDTSLGTASDGSVNFLFSVGGYPAQDFGEVVTTYRLLSWSQAPEGMNAEQESFEQAVAIGYRGNFSSWVKSFGHTLTYFDYRGGDPEQTEADTPGEEVLAKEGDYQQWQSRVELSCGDDLPGWSQGLLHGYRLDLHLETQTALQRSGLLPGGSHPAGAAWGSLLRLNTAFGTLSGKLSRSANQHRLALGLQKSGLAGARVKLYYEDIDYRSLGELETRIGGQLNLPLDETLLKILTPGYWRPPETRLFAAQPTRGYTAPRRGQHVPSLNNTTPGILQ